jgi:hypothetical protein
MTSNPIFWVADNVTVASFVDVAATVLCACLVLWIAATLWRDSGSRPLAVGMVFAAGAVGAVWLWNRVS